MMLIGRLFVILLGYVAAAIVYGVARIKFSFAVRTRIHETDVPYGRGRQRGWF